MDKFTIVIPVYNEAKNLKILIQRFTENSKIKFEIIIVDDNSNDGTYEILKKFKKKFQAHN